MPEISSPQSRRAALPPGSCNAHVHVFGPRERFPYAAGASFVPEVDAPKEALYALNDGLGLQRCVVVQSTCHGLDNSATEDAVRGRAGSYVGVALVPTDVADSELRRLDAAGFRAARFNYMAHLGARTPADEVIALARRLEPLGWHLQIHFDASLIDELTPMLRRSPVPVVIDHMGRIDASLGMQQPAFDSLRRLLEDERFWVKVSGCDRASRQGPPYADAVPFARRLVTQFPTRTLWGTDWPHPNIAGPVPDDLALAALLQEIAPDAMSLQRLLVDNPARLYRFSSAEAA